MAIDPINKSTYNQFEADTGVYRSKPYDVQIVLDVLIDKVNEILDKVNTEHP